MARTIASDEVRSLLEELATRLSDAGVSAGIRVVGGAALALLDPRRRVTADIDAAISPPGAATEIVAEMAAEHDLPADWLNDAALAYIPPVGLDDWTEVITTHGVTVYIGSLRMLLAMKLRANRGVRDNDDIAFLLNLCNITCLSDAQEIYERYHAQDVLPDAAAARIEHWLEHR